MTAYAFEPPIGRLLLVIRERLNVGESFQPGNRQLADWLGYASAGHIHHLLDQLACDGRIRYDPDRGRITLLADPSSGSASDQGDGSTDPTKGSIPQRDRFFQHQDAVEDRGFNRDQVKTACMESIITTTSTESVVVVDSGGMQGGDQRADRSPAVAQLMAELGANPKIIRDAYQSRPDWTAQQVRQRWEYDQKRIAISDGRLNEGVFFTALRSGELAPARPDPTRPIDPADYADDPAWRLGSDTTGLDPCPPNVLPPDPPPAAIDPPVESIRDHASRLLPSPTAETLKTHTRDWMFLQCRLGAGDSDDEALSALAEHRTAVRR